MGVTGTEMVLTAVPPCLFPVNLPQDDTDALVASAARKYSPRNGLVLAFQRRMANAYKAAGAVTGAAEGLLRGAMRLRG